MTLQALLAHQVEGPPDGPPVVLAPSLGTTRGLWAELAAALRDRYRVVRFDTRGHGSSPVPPGPYTVAELADDVLRLADHLELGRFALVGLSLGGAVGQLLGVTHPDRLAGLVLGCTVPRFGDPASWRDRAATVRAEGMEVLTEPTRGRWFTDEFRASRPDEVERLISMIRSTPAEGYAGCCEALADFDLWSRLDQVGVPTRVIAGDRDQTASLPEVENMSRAIPGADLVVLEAASHIANVAAPDRFNDAVVEHLGRIW